MKTFRNELSDVGLTAISAFAILAGHQALRSWIAGMSIERGAADFGATLGIASVAASAVVHLLAGVFVLPRLLARTRGVGAASGLRVAGATALVLVLVRALAEAGLGVRIDGLPLLPIAVGLAWFVHLREAPRAAVRPMAAQLRAVVGGRRAGAPGTPNRRAAS